MFTNLHTQKGFAALIGLLIVVLIIALLVYGGSFFSEKSQKSRIETYVEVEKHAEDMIGNIEFNNAERQREIEKLEK